MTHARGFGASAAEAERTTMPLAADAAPASPAWEEQARSTVPLVGDVTPDRAVLPFRAPGMPVERREIPTPPASGVRVVQSASPPAYARLARRRGWWPLRVALALVTLVLYTAVLGVILGRRTARAPGAVGEASVPTASPLYVLPPAPSPTPTPPSVASAERPRVMPSANAPSVRTKRPRTAPSAVSLPAAHENKRPPLPFGGDDVHNPWRYE